MIICKICNPTLEGNGYCAEHSTNGTAYKTVPKEKEIKEKFGELKPCKICGKPTYFENHISCKFMKAKELKEKTMEILRKYNLEKVDLDPQGLAVPILERDLKLDYEYANQILELFSQEKQKLIHDNEILVNTIIDTKNKEKQKAIEEYALKVIPHINKKWRERIEKLENKEKEDKT